MISFSNLIADSLSSDEQEIDIGIEDTFSLIYTSIHHPQSDQQQAFKSLLGSSKMPMKRNRRRRTAFTHSQLAFLERKFRCQKYLSVADRGEVASQLSLSETQVKTWWERECVTFHELFETHHLLFLPIEGTRTAEQSGNVKINFDSSSFAIRTRWQKSRRRHSHRSSPMTSYAVRRWKSFQLVIFSPTPWQSPQQQIILHLCHRHTIRIKIVHKFSFLFAVVVVSSSPRNDCNRA